MSTTTQQLRDLLARELGRVVIGVEASVDAMVVALIARGHVLLQGVPGLGKTLFAKALARAFGGEFKRIQGTADLRPSDIIGVHVVDEVGRSVGGGGGGGGGGAAGSFFAVRRRTSSCWRRRTRANSREPSRCPNRSSI